MRGGPVLGEPSPAPPAPAMETVVVVILLREDGAALLQLRDEKPGLRHAGMWGLPGGHSEPGESVEETARREFKEETGYTCEMIHRLASFEDGDDTRCPPYRLVMFWSRYDGTQPLECREGQRLRFVPRAEAPAERMPPHILPVWDMAIAESRKRDGPPSQPMAAQVWEVPYAALGLQTAELKGELLTAVERVFDAGQYVLGPSLAAFEEEFARYCRTAFAVGVGSGTSALSLVLRWVGVGPGDEVITVPNSFVASAAAIALAGGRPVFVDVGRDLNMDPDLLESAITPRTKLVMPVHLTGRPARMPQILEVARRHGLFVLEDAAQSIGAALHGRPVGGWGGAACFSLHPLKNLHAIGDGGVVTTDHPGLRAWLLKARNHGLRSRDECEFWSENSRLDELHAAMLRIQLPHLERWTAERRRLAARYHERLRRCVEVPDEGPGEHCVYQTYVIQAERRDALVRWLRRQGVEACIHYPTPLHLQPAARALGYGPDDFPVATRAAGRIVSLPLYPGMTEAQQDRVVELIAAFYSSSAP